MSEYDHRFIVAEAIKKDKFVRAFFLIDEKEKLSLIHISEPTRPY